VQVDATYEKSLVLNSALHVFEKTAGTGVVVFHPEYISGNIQPAVLVTEFRVGCGLIRRGID